MHEAYVDVDPAKLSWAKATASNPSGNCVEVAHLGDGRVALRDSKQPDSGFLVYTENEIACFVDGFLKGEFEG